MKRFILILLLWTVSLPAAESDFGLLALSQGISAPSKTSPLVFSDGFTHENPSVVATLSGWRASGAYERGNDSGFGAELGLGNSKFGVAVGYGDHNCLSCGGDADISAAVAGQFGNIGMGLGVREQFYSVGLLFGSENGNRLGLVGEFNESIQNDFTTIGLGYKFQSSDFVAALDVSKRLYKRETATHKSYPLIVTPGIAFKLEFLQFSLNYDLVLDDNRETVDNDFWAGIGFQIMQKVQLAVYLDYVSDFALVGTYYF